MEIVLQMGPFDRPHRPQVDKDVGNVNMMTTNL